MVVRERTPRMAGQDYNLPVLMEVVVFFAVLAFVVRTVVAIVVVKVKVPAIVISYVVIVAVAIKVIIDSIDIVVELVSSPSSSRL